MVQKHWLQLKMKFLLGYDMRLSSPGVCVCGGGGGGGDLCIFSAGGRDSPPIPLVGKPLLN